jgi:hypothetical protein
MQAVAETLCPLPKKRTNNPQGKKKKTVLIPLKTSDLEDFDSVDWDHDAEFLKSAWAAPAIWRDRKNKPKNFLAVERKQLILACVSALEHLERKKMTAVLALRPRSDRIRHSLQRGHRRYLNLIKMLRRAASAAAAESSGVTPLHPSHYVRKLHYKKAREVFAIRYLSAEARRLFRIPLHDEVAITVTVLMHLSKPVKLDRVLDLWKTRPRG